MLKIIVWGLVIFCLWSLLVSLYAYYVYTHPSRQVSSVTPDDYNIGYEPVSFSSSDGVKLKGWFIPGSHPEAPTVIVCHGYPFDKGNILDLALCLYPDYNLFLFDFRAMGESEGSYFTAGWKEVSDLEGAVVYLQGRGETQIGAMGFSLGAAVIILANNSDIKGLVADSSFSDLNALINVIFRNLGPFKWSLVKLTKLWVRLFMGMDTGQVSPLRTMAFLPSPILLIHGTEDREIPVDHSRQLYQAAVSTDKDAELWLVPGADHGQAYYMDSEEYSRRVKAFFARVFGR